MFTGIIRHIGSLRQVRSTAAGKRLSIDLGPLAPQAKPGDSVAVDGVCLTVAAIAGATCEFDAIAETLDRSTLGRLSTGARVNLELSLRLGDGLDGHIVQGHVDGIARLRAILRGGQHVLEFSASRELTELMVPKGSVAVAGVSLTLVDVGDNSFSVALIPTTLGETTLGELKVGSEVNIETDIIGRYIRKYVQPPTGGALTLEKLKQAGFA